MFDRYAFPSIALMSFALFMFGAAGCGDQPNGEVESGATIAAEAEHETSAADAVEVAEAEPAESVIPEEIADAIEPEQSEEPGEEVADQTVESERGEDRAAAVEVDEEIARRHIGAWIAEGGRLAGSRFIFTDGGHAQMGNHAMMFSGEYTIDYSHDDPHLFIRVDVMGRPVDTHFFVEYLPDDQLLFHLATPDPEASSGVRRQTGSDPMLLVRDE